MEITIDIIKKWKEQRNFQKLYIATKSDNVLFRKMSVEALGYLEDIDAENILIKLLKEDIDDVKRSVIEALGKIGSRKVVPDLMMILTNSSNPDLRKSSAEALGNIKDNSCVDALINAMDDDNDDVRKYSAEAIGELADGRGTNKLIKAIHKDKKEVRRKAVESLGKIGNKDVVDELIRKLEDEDSEVRRCSAEAIGKIGGDRAIEWLIRILSSEKNDEVRRMSVIALGKMLDTKIVEPIVEALDDKSIDVQNAVIEVIERIGTPQAIEILRIIKRNSELIQTLKKALHQYSEKLNTFATTYQTEIRQLSTG
jgi:HEAT repeat protein